MKTPSDIYFKKIKANNWQSEASQLDVLATLDQCAAHIHTQHNNTWLNRIKKSIWHKKKCFNVFCYGPVGRGKTMLMDCFYEAIPQCIAIRRHFYSFMTEIHARLKDTNINDPLDDIAKKFSKHYQVCCLDEFLVDDIADAMVLGGLLQAFQRHGVSVITNGNTPPNQLYRHGIQRASFLPTIAFLEANYHVIECKSAIDFRKKNSSIQRFFRGNPTEQDQFLQYNFDQIALTTPHETQQLMIHQRKIVIRKRTNHTLWIDFNALCQPPRAAPDYLWLCEHFKDILIGGIEPIDPSNKIELVNWIKWIDICYDRQVRLIVAANCQLSDICPNHHKDYTRCDSRLHQML